MATFLTPLSPIMGAGETVSSVTATNSVIPGTLWADTSGNQYVYVYNAGNSQISQGLAAVISGLSGYSVTVSSVAGTDGFPVGIAKNATLTTATYGWLMYRGFSGFTAQASDSFATGDAICLGTDGKMAMHSNATAFSAAITIGKCILSTASGTSNAGTIAAYFSF